MAITIKQSLADQLSRTIQQRQGTDPTIKKWQTQATSTLSPQEVRAKNNGRLNNPRTPMVDVYQDEINAALQSLNQGYYSEAARISQLALSTDDWISGVFGTFTASISSLPRSFVGDPEIKRDLSQGYAGIAGDPRSLFDTIVRPSVFASLLVDMRMLGTAVAELVWLPDLDYPIVVRLDPQFLELDRLSETWMYRTDTGVRLRITPGDGRWILLTPGGASQPWLGGIWAGVCRSYSRKTEALLNLDSWLRKHASPIRVGQTSQGATGADYDDFLEDLISFSGTNSQTVLPPGWSVQLLEGNGRGFESYLKTVELANQSLTVAIAGQLGTTLGSEGFDNLEIGLTVRGDLTKRYAIEIATGFSDQLLPYVVASRYGSVDRRVALVLETAPPKDKVAAANALTASASAISAVVSAVTAAQAAGINTYVPDVSELMRQFGIPEAEVQTVVATVQSVTPALSAPTTLPALPADTEPAAVPA